MSRFLSAIDNLPNIVSNARKTVKIEAINLIATFLHIEKQLRDENVALEVSLEKMSSNNTQTNQLIEENERLRDRVD